jgi:hypothetical protein
MYRQEQGFVVIPARETPVEGKLDISKQHQKLLSRFSQIIFQRFDDAPPPLPVRARLGRSGCLADPATAFAAALTKSFKEAATSIGIPWSEQARLLRPADARDLQALAYSQSLIDMLMLQQHVAEKEQQLQQGEQRLEPQEQQQEQEQQRQEQGGQQQQLGERGEPQQRQEKLQQQGPGEPLQDQGGHQQQLEEPLPPPLPQGREQLQRPPKGSSLLVATCLFQLRAELFPDPEVAPRASACEVPRDVPCEDLGQTQEESETDDENKYQPDGEGGQRRMSFFSDMRLLAAEAGGLFKNSPPKTRTVTVQLPGDGGSIKVSKKAQSMVRKFGNIHICRSHRLCCHNLFVTLFFPSPPCPCLL